MVLTENQQNLMRWGGVILFMAANTLMLVAGYDTETTTPQVQQNAKVLSVVCETYLANHTTYDVPPPNCEAELRYLIRRINATLKEIEDVRNGHAIPVPESSPAEEDSNS